MKKGIILDVDSDFITFLTPDGQFLKALRKKKNYEIGEEISFQPINSKFQMKNSFLFKYKRKSFLIASIASLFLMISLFPLFYEDEVSAYMTVDINPSVEMGLNKDLEVIKLSGLNKDGKTLISRMDHWKKKDVLQVANKLIKDSRKNGFLKARNEILVSTVIVNKRNQKIERSLTNQLGSKKFRSRIPDAKVTIYNASVSDRKKAIKQGVSTGIYMKEHTKNDSALNPAAHSHKPKAKHNAPDSADSNSLNGGKEPLTSSKNKNHTTVSEENINNQDPHYPGKQFPNRQVDKNITSSAKEEQEIDIKREQVKKHKDKAKEKKNTNEAAGKGQRDREDQRKKPGKTQTEKREDHHEKDKSQREKEQHDNQGEKEGRLKQNSKKPRQQDSHNDIEQGHDDRDNGYRDLNKGSFRKH